MQISEGEYLFIYNSNMIQDKTAKGYALSIKHVKINEKDIHKDHLTPKQIAEIANHLDISIKELYREKSATAYEQFTDDELIRVLSIDPSKMKTPIIVSPKHSFIVGSSYELIKEELSVNETK
ncbi:arsenate reductase family protein [Marinoscillum sp.]|uniref:arsenate reductase family protein n=1 Tax=Marinoscillum sp. TaxID=2024838 RepID=UPI003BABE4B2